MKKYSNSFRSRNWSIMIYEDPSVYLSSLLSLSIHYVYICHDKDDTEPHYHLLVILPHAKTFTALKSFFTGSQNFFAEPISDKYTLFRYLLHLDNPEKYQYSSDLLISDSLDYWNSLDPDNIISPSGEKMLSLLDDINLGKSLRYLIGTYGRDVVYHYDELITMARRLLVEDHEHRVPVSYLVPADDSEFPS